MELHFGPEALQPALRKTWAVVVVFAVAGTLAQLPVLFVGFGPVLWANFLGGLALALALWLGRQTWRRVRAGPRLHVVLQGQSLSTHWSGEAKEAIVLGPDARVSVRMGWLTVQSGGGGVAIPWDGSLTRAGVSSVGRKEFKDALNTARFGDRLKRFRGESPLTPANDPVTPDPGKGALHKVARGFATASLATLAESATHTGGTAKFAAAMNLIGSAMLALLGVLLLVIGVGNLLS